MIRVLNKFLIFRRLVVRARDTAYTEKNIKKAFESTGIHPLNPRTVLGKLKPKNEESRNITRTDGTSPPPVTPTAPRAIGYPKSHDLQMVTRNTPSSSKLKVLIDQLGKAAEGTAADKDLSIGMLKDLRSKAKDLSSAAAKDRCQLSKARVIGSEEAVRLRDERERKDNIKAVRAAAREKKKQGATQKLAPRTKSKGKEIEVICLEEELEEFHLSGSDYETMDEEADDTPGLEEEEEEDSFVDIDGTPGTRCDQEGRIRGAGMVGKRVEVVTRSGRRAGRVVSGK